MRTRTRASAAAVLTVAWAAGAAWSQTPAGRDTREGLRIVPGRALAEGFSRMSDSKVARQRGPRFFVATDGDDRWSGTLPEPNAQRSDGPFATLHRARDAAREAMAATERRLVRVIVREGRYFLHSPLALGPEDSGLRIEAAGGERVTLSGGRVVTGWKPYRGRIMRADISTLGLTDYGFRQLYCDGRRQPMARAPNFDPEHPRTGGFAYNADIVENDSLTKFRYKPQEVDPRRWAHPERALVDFFSGWNYGNDIYPVKSVDTSAHVLETAGGRYPLQPDDRFYVMNVFEELDAPGEWYCDPEARALYLWPPDDHLGRSEVIVPALDALFAIQGAAQAAVEGVALRRLEMRDCRGAAVRITAARRCTVSACAFRNVGSAVTLGDETHHCRVVGCDITGTGSHAIELAGTPEQHERVSHHVLDNNYIYDFGWSDRGCAGIYITCASHCKVTHNHIHDGPRWGICHNAGNDNEFAYNHLHHLNLETCDTGAIYTVTCAGGWDRWMNLETNLLTRGNEIHHNLIHDSGGYGKVEPGVWEYPHYCWGIYLDLASSGYHVHDNVVYNTDLGGLMIGGGQDNLCENNVFADGRRHQVYFCAWVGPQHTFPMARNRIERNIIAYRTPEARLYQIGNARDEWATFRANLVSAPGEPVVHVEWHRELSWREWRARGQDEGSLVADPLFVDADRRDYRLRPESPARALGFTPIDLTRVGNYRSPHRCTWPRPEVEVFREEPITRSSYGVEHAPPAAGAGALTPPPAAPP